MLEEVDHQVVGWLGHQVRERVGVDDRLQLGRRADHEVGAQAHPLFKAAFQALFDIGVRTALPPQHQVAAGQQGLGVVEAQVLGQAKQVVLQHLASADIDGPQQGDVRAHQRTPFSATFLS
jgi:hypothetical protein